MFLNTFAKVRREAGLLYASHFCRSEVCNGGFEQFFSNSTGVLAPEAIDGFEAIGQANMAVLVRNAASMLGRSYPRERSQRQAALAAIAPHAFDAIEDQFYDLLDTESGGFDVAADAYVARLNS